MEPIDMFEELFKKAVKMEGRFLEVTVGTAFGQGPRTATVRFINLPEARVKQQRGGGAEAMNNIVVFSVFPTQAAGKLRVTRGADSLHISWKKPVTTKLRGKSGTPEVIAKYLAEHVNELVAKIPPSFTHE